ncbi:MAG: nickel pincer cofactor biosynthesis protein LarB [Dehalococcoidia bacterium]|mgnify:CR=1 FL=1
MKNILTLLAEGAISIDDAERQLKLFAVHELKGMANLDIGRNKRVGKPDVVRAKGKTNEQVMILVAPILDEEGLVIVSGATAEHRTRLNEQYHDIEIDFDSDAAILVAKKNDYKLDDIKGKVSIITAGTSDMPVALQSKVVLGAFDVDLDIYQDVGIAGLHRLLWAVEKIIENDTSVIIAVAGQEGGLAPVLAGLVDIPVIGVPTSTGSGFGGEGIAALSTMLQSCSLGLSVVNIDNGLAAAIVALTILRK